jgi:DNA-binding NarL/FixJ family response regulator
MTKSLYSPIRVVLADDHEIFRDGFRIMLKKQNEIELTGEAENGLELIKLVDEIQPDVIITDIKMPKLDGVGATKTLHQKYPHIGIIALSMFEDDTLIVDMLEAGAKGYLLKNATKLEIFDAIKTVNNQGAYYCHNTSARLALLIAKSRFNPYKKTTGPVFNDREIDLIRFICREFSNKEIASKMNFSVRTIEGYRDKIQEKMGVKNTAGIVIYAIKNGIYKI